MSEEGEPHGRARGTAAGGILGVVAGVILLGVLVLAVDPLRSGIGDALSGDSAQLRHDLHGLGVGGVVITLIIALAHVFIWYPAEILDAAVGYVYGFWGGLVLIMFGWIGNALLAYMGWPAGGAAGPLPVHRPATVSSAWSGSWSREAIPLLLGMRRRSRDPLQLLLDRRRRRARRPAHIRLDDGGRLSAADRGLRLPRNASREPLPHRPGAAGDRRRAGRRPGHRPPLTAG